MTTQREISTVLNKLASNIIKTEQLLLKADKILQQLQTAHDDACSENEEGGACVATILHKEEMKGESEIFLVKGARVVWLIREDDEPVLGTVLWTGWMSDGVVAGVEFDDPIGNTDGSMDGIRLFHCKPRHGRFVLVRELILWEDFAGPAVFDEK